MEFSTFQAAKILKTDYTCLNEWLKLIDLKKKASGRGTRTKLPIVDLYRLKTFEVMIDVIGLDRKTAAKIVDQLNDTKADDWGKKYISLTFGIDKLAFGHLTSDAPQDAMTKNGTITIEVENEQKKKSPIVAQLSIKLSTIKTAVDARLKEVEKEI